MNGSESEHNMQTLLPNFRKVTGCPSDRLIYRSSSPHSIPSNQIAPFLNLGIRTIIDMRSREERENPENSSLFPYYLFYTYDEISSEWRQETSDSQPLAPIGCVYRIDFYTQKSRRLICGRSLLTGHNVPELHLDFVNSTGEDSQLFKNAIALPARHAHTVPTMAETYLDLLEMDPSGIREIFKLLSKQPPQTNFPVLIHCSIGKDRTGFLSVFIQHCCGCPSEIIINDYALSDLFLTPLRPLFESVIKKYHLNEEFCRSEEKTIREFLALIQTKYGGIDGYLKAYDIKLT